VRVDDLIAGSAAGRRRDEVRHEFRQVIVHVLFADELLPAEGDAEDASARVQPFGGALALALPRDDVDLVAKAGEAPCEFDHEGDLAAGVGQPQLRLHGGIAVQREHQDRASVGGHQSLRSGLKPQ